MLMPLPYALSKAIDDFFTIYVSTKSISLYNEISLQLELGLYLRNLYPKYKVEFERNIKDFAKRGFSYVKKEIDLVISDGDEEYAIELKFPRNGQYPEEMFEFIKDIQFMEEVKAHAGFKEAYCVTLVDDTNFWSTGRAKTKLYQYFRQPVVPIPNGVQILRPTKKKGIPSVKVDHDYLINWEPITFSPLYPTVNPASCRYYIIDVK
jgi:hypothetical protein